MVLPSTSTTVWWRRNLKQPGLYWERLLTPYTTHVAYTAVNLDSPRLWSLHLQRCVCDQLRQLCLNGVDVLRVKPQGFFLGG